LERRLPGTWQHQAAADLLQLLLLYCGPLLLLLLQVHRQLLL
jgi:hypothetical protein